jgi:hypothetical protein
MTIDPNPKYKIGDDIYTGESHWIYFGQIVDIRDSCYVIEWQDGLTGNYEIITQENWIKLLTPDIKARLI